jgi:hypothetical protein
MAKTDIEKIERYQFDGKEFHDLKEVSKYIEEQIGNILDQTPNRLPPAERIGIFDILVANRERLTTLLSATYWVDEGFGGRSSIFLFDPPKKVK